MYLKPQVQKFGTFRELTQIGLTASADGGSIFGNGCKTWIFEIGCPVDGEGSPTVS